MAFYLAGLLIGGLAGTVVTLLLAPQSGKKTRATIQQKGMELRDQTTEAVEAGVTQARTKAHQMTTGIHKQVEELQQRSQDVLDEGRERFSTAVEAGKTAVQRS